MATQTMTMTAPPCGRPLKEVAFLDFCEVIPQAAETGAMSRLNHLRTLIVRSASSLEVPTINTGRLSPIRGLSPSRDGSSRGSSPGTSPVRVNPEPLPSPSLAQTQASPKLQHVVPAPAPAPSQSLAHRVLGSARLPKLLRRDSKKTESSSATSSPAVSPVAVARPVALPPTSPQTAPPPLAPAPVRHAAAPSLTDSVSTASASSLQTTADTDSPAVVNPSPAPSLAIKPVAVRKPLDFGGGADKAEVKVPTFPQVVSRDSLPSVGTILEPLNTECVCKACEEAIKGALEPYYEPNWSLPARRKYLSDEAHRKAIRRQTLSAAERLQRAADGISPLPSARSSLDITRDRRPTLLADGTAASDDDEDEGSADEPGIVQPPLMSPGLPTSSVEAPPALVVAGPHAVVDADELELIRSGTRSPWDERLQQEIQDELAGIAEQDRRRRAMAAVAEQPKRTSSAGGGARAMMRQLEDAERRERLAQEEREARRSRSSSIVSSAHVEPQGRASMDSHPIPMGAVCQTSSKPWTPPVRIGSPAALGERRSASPLASLLLRRSSWHGHRDGHGGHEVEQVPVRPASTAPGITSSSLSLTGPSRSKSPTLARAPSPVIAISNPGATSHSPRWDPAALPPHAVAAAAMHRSSSPRHHIARRGTPPISALQGIAETADDAES